MALYHTYRPQQFSDVVGQEHIVKTITNQIANNKVAHAYLFSGPRGVGKTTVARLLAKSVNGKKKKGSLYEPDLTDPAVIEISESRAIDVIEIDAASHTGVDNVRENIIENAQFKPTKLPYKVFIIDEVHMLSTSAFNALLKTLEEPPSHVIFVLATTELHKLPETIISRCQRFTFKRVPYDTLFSHIESVAKAEKVTVDPDVINRIINKSDGCVRDAISLLDQLLASGEKKITPEVASLVLPASNADDIALFLESLIQKNAKKALEQLWALSEHGISIQQFAHDLLEMQRYLLIYSVTQSPSAQSIDYSKKVIETLETLITSITQQELLTLIEMTLHRKGQIQFAPIEELPLEMLIIDWCGNNTQENSPRKETNEQTEQNTTAQVEQKEIPQQTLTEEKPQKTHSTVVEKVKDMISHKPFQTKESVESSWSKVIDRIESEYPSMSFILKMASIDRIEGHSIILHVPYSFHGDKLNSNELQRNIQPVLEEIYGTGVKMVAEVNIDQQQNNAGADELHELAAAFGGEVIQ